MSATRNLAVQIERKLRDYGVQMEIDSSGALRCRVAFSHYSSGLDKELLEILLKGSVVVWSEEEVDAPGLSTELESLASGVWFGVASSVNTIGSWLYLGGWSMCDAPAQEVVEYVKLTPIIESERDYVGELFRRGTTVFVSSFFDNCEWDIWLAGLGGAKHVGPIGL